MSRKPLEGVRVVEFAQLIAGPGAGRALALLGADVVKVEPIGGESARHIGAYGTAMLRAYNLGKRSIELNLRDADDAAAARALALGADVVIQNLRPGALDALGLGADELMITRPGLVYASVSGYPADGPAAARAGLDIAAQAESGMMSMTGETGRDPQRVGYPIVDAACADLLAQGILAALLGRERTGRGAHVQISLLEVALHLQTPAWAEYAGTGVEPVRSGNGQATLAPAADVVRVADGEVVISAYTPDHWAILCRVMGRPELVGDPRLADNAQRVAHRDLLGEMLHDAFGALTRDEVVRRLERVGLVGGPVRGYRDVLATADAEVGPIFVTVADNGPGELRIPRAPYRCGSEPAYRAAPAVGEHSAEIRAELAGQVRR